VLIKREPPAELVVADPVRPEREASPNLDDPMAFVPSQQEQQQAELRRSQRTIKANPKVTKFLEEEREALRPKKHGCPS
jgi:hypothetical protein